ncbi:YkvA family protein [Jiella pelagia]|uniref:YkvA family protein n=1 Tax=Jiella pelagia TaxID=2986949 RepID=A0ABY7C8Y8_9HYPH|nr:YkvA family protein [Jiella pelagia]WAP71263.1 YkvA family protein [Jiella pelagia]
MDEHKIEEILRIGSQEEFGNREKRVRSSFFGTVRRAMRHIPFMEDVVASYYCAIDPETPSATRGILIAALAYFVLPIDIVPDMLLGIGFTDDIAVLLTAFNAVRGNVRPEHYRRAREVLDDL